jgi:uracil-DNA glycosylase
MIPSALSDCLTFAHPSWHPVLLAGLRAVDQADPAYLPALVQADYLPNGGRLFAAFRQSLDQVRHVLVGEGPYPRPLSATGVCFMDGAVGTLWSDKGLSKEVNRATSLRNFMKMLLVAEGSLSQEASNGEALAAVSARARAPGSGYCQTLAEIEQSLHAHGFLLLNASLVFRPEVPPIRDGRAWRPFFQAVLDALAARGELTPPKLILWGKVAELVTGLPGVDRFPKLIAEHPYNLSFIGNQAMQDFFRPLHLVRAEASMRKDSSSIGAMSFRS